MSDSWSLSQIWNNVRDVDRTRSYEPRDYIWASELGGSFYDRYWKMHGRDATTPPNLRSQRKFDAGNLTEWVVKQVLVRAHIYHEGQTHIVNTEGKMKVTGRVDFIAGGKIHPVDTEDLPDVLRDVSEATLARLAEQYPEGLPEQGLEIKSISGFAFNNIEKAPFTHHALQAFHYAYSRQLPFHLIYINKDDLRMVEWVIAPDSEKWKDMYFEDIRTMDKIYDLPENDTNSLKEPLLLYNPEEKKFKKNLKVEYSSYLTDYGFERPDQYAEGAKISTRLNNVVKSIIAGKKLSKLNLDALEKGKKFYPPAVSIIINLREQYENEATN